MGEGNGRSEWKGVGMGEGVRVGGGSGGSRVHLTYAFCTYSICVCKYVVLFRFQVKFEVPNRPFNEIRNPETTLY